MGKGMEEGEGRWEKEKWENVLGPDMIATNFALRITFPLSFLTFFTLSFSLVVSSIFFCLPLFIPHFLFFRRIFSRPMI